MDCVFTRQGHQLLQRNTLCSDRGGGHCGVNVELGNVGGLGRGRGVELNAVVTAVGGGETAFIGL